MPKGGKREGAGRKAQGETRKVSLTLTTEEWTQIKKSGLTVAAFLKRLIHGQAEAPPVTEPNDYPRHYVEERWETHLRMADDLPSTDVLEAAKDALMRNLYPRGTEYAVVRTHEQYECPFTGKRFGSMNTLVKAAIPHLLKSVEYNQQHKKELARIRERENSPRYI